MCSITNTMLFLFGAFLLGAVFVILIELIILYKWFQKQPTEDLKELPTYKPVNNPEDIAKYCGLDGATEKESCMFLNLIFQFLWREWRDSPKTRNFFISKMNLEFQEMLLNKAAGKLMEQIKVRDYYLGDSLPVFKSATIMKIDSKNYSEVPREIDIAVDVEYSGGFVISLDVDLIFGKTASLSIKLNKLVGRVRLQYTRNPCTHWSFSFYEDPIMDVHVDSNFEGKTLPKLTSFIHNQILKSIRKKHTLPRYKVRYKPFFIQEQPQDGKNEVFVHNGLVTVGKIDLEIVECTRIPKLPKGSHIYCSLSLDPLPWKEDMPMKRSSWPVHEVLMSKTQSGSLGVGFAAVRDRNFDNEYEVISIKTIFPNSPATQVDIQKGDILISVNNVDITNMKQAKRLIRNTGDKFTFKLQRPPLSSELPDTPSPDMEDGNGNNAIEEPRDLPHNSTGDDPRTTERNNFDYNSYVLQDDDSETEEFVNIVVNELSKEITNDEAKKLMQEVKTMKRASLASDNMSMDGIDHVDRSSFTPAAESICSVEHDAEISESETPHRRSFSFFRKNKNSPNLKSSLKRRLSDLSLLNDSKGSSPLENSYSAPGTSSNDASNSTQKSKKEVRINEPFNVSEEGHEELENNTSVSTDRASSEPSKVKKQTSEDNPDWDNISHHNLDAATLETELPPQTTTTEEEKEPTGQRTSHQNANKDLVWNEMFSFDVEKEHRFLNICVWCKHEESFEKDVLLGYISIPLMELAVECLSTSSRKNIRKFHLTATSVRSAISRTYLRTVMPGLNLSCCHGDITIAYRYFISTPEDKLEEESKVDKSKKIEVPLSGETNFDDNDEGERTHNFIGQEFYFPTRCDYCQNKIWRKVAFQCLVCGMVSHKRCIQNVQANTYCTRKGVRAKPPKWQSKQQPTATATANDDNKKPTNSSSEDNSSPLPTRIPARLTVPDDSDLRPGIKNDGRTSPNVLRRRNKQPYQKKHARNLSLQDLIREDKSCQNIPEDVEDGDQNDSIATAAVTAKEAGRELFASLDKDSREENIQSKVDRLQREVTKEKEQQLELRHSFDRTDDIELKQKYTFLIRKSEERSQALALLMIQYCAALNECLSIGESQQVDL